MPSKGTNDCAGDPVTGYGDEFSVCDERCHSCDAPVARAWKTEATDRCGFVGEVSHSVLGAFPGESARDRRFSPLSVDVRAPMCGPGLRLDGRRGVE